MDCVGMVVDIGTRFNQGQRGSSLGSSRTLLFPQPREGFLTAVQQPPLSLFIPVSLISSNTEETLRAMEFWSLHSSLYPSVTIQQRHLLEEAVRWTVQGCYDHAQDIFRSQALRSSTLPIVGIEQAILFERMGLEVQRWELLERFPKPLNRTTPNTGADEWDLLDIFRVNCTLMLQGRLRRAVNVAAEVATRLVKKSLASYSDIEGE